ncbi:MAG: hypothetical protein MJ025_05665 [Victivallaceae bacterium]|nr:hypothetical protein [Victivallaceae bacterium]
MNADPDILQLKYADVIALLARTEGISLDTALGMFYKSKTYQLMRKGVSDMHCMSCAYLVESILVEST